MLALRIVLFNLWSISHRVSLGNIAISLNPMTDWASEFGQPKYLLSASWIATIPSFGWSVEYFMYHVSARSYSALTNMAFLMFSSIMPCASHTYFITNQNRLGSSFPTPWNFSNSTVIAIPAFGGGGGGGGVGVGRLDVGEAGGGVDGGGISGKHSLINQTALPGENLARSSSLSHEIEIKGLFSTSPILR